MRSPNSIVLCLPRPVVVPVEGLCERKKKKTAAAGRKGRFDQPDSVSNTARHGFGYVEVKFPSNPTGCYSNLEALATFDVVVIGILIVASLFS